RNLTTLRTARHECLARPFRRIAEHRGSAERTSQFQGAKVFSCSASGEVEFERQPARRQHDQEAITPAWLKRHRQALRCELRPELSNESQAVIWVLTCSVSDNHALRG